VRPNGDVWFSVTSGSQSKVGRLAHDGTITEYAVASPGFDPSSLTFTANGDVWYDAAGNGFYSQYAEIGRITPDGKVAEFLVPGTGHTVQSIAAGPDGNVWFTEELTGPETGPSGIGRVSPDGTITILPTDLVTDPDYPPGARYSVDSSLIRGSDGNLYFLEDSFGYDLQDFPSPPGAVTAPIYIFHSVAALGEITAAGLATGTPLPALNGSIGAAPGDLASGPDGNLWFGGVNAPTVDKITIPDAVPTKTQFPPPAPQAVSAKVVSNGGRGVDAQVVVTFTQPLDPTSASAPGNYSVVQLYGSAAPRSIDSAVYNPAANTVTIRVRGALSPYVAARLTINGATPGGIVSVADVGLTAAGGKAHVSVFTL
jgi:streptogramin lyase